MKIKEFFKSDKFIKPALTVLISLLITVVFISLVGLINGINPMQLISTMLFWPLENIRRIGDIVAQMSWLIPVSLAFAIAYKTGLFNIGMSGQMLFSGMIGVYLGIQGVSWVLLLPIMIISGALIGALSGYLKAQFKIHEVVSTIMLNWAIFYVYTFVYKPGRSFISTVNSDSLPVSEASSLRLDFISKIFTFKTVESKASLAIVFALLAAAVIHVLIKKSRLGYELTATGLSEQAARNAGINTKLKIIKSMGIAGGLSGIAAMALYIGSSQNLSVQSSVPLEGFDGIAVSLIAGNNPIGIVITSFFYSVISQSSQGFSKFNLDGQLIVIVNSILILGVAISPSLIKKYREYKAIKINTGITPSKVEKTKSKTKAVTAPKADTVVKPVEKKTTTKPAAKKAPAKKPAVKKSVTTKKAPAKKPVAKKPATAKKAPAKKVTKKAGDK